MLNLKTMTSEFFMRLFFISYRLFLSQYGGCKELFLFNYPTRVFVKIEPSPFCSFYVQLLAVSIHSTEFFKACIFFLKTNLCKQYNLQNILDTCFFLWGEYWTHFYFQYYFRRVQRFS